MHRIIAHRLASECTEGFTYGGKHYTTARIRDNALQISPDHGATWEAVEWHAAEWHDRRSGRRISFWREEMEYKALRLAEWYVWIAAAMALGCIVGVVATW